MDKPLISVLMPCLNMERYIRSSIDSVVNQTIKNIEILVIDAGSTDRTLQILKEYSDKDMRIKILHSPQKSYGHQMNMGIAEARGEYIGIADADDYLIPDAYEALYEAVRRSGADYAKGTAEGFFDFDNHESYRFRIAPYSLGEYRAGIEIVPRDTPSIIFRDTFLWYGLYRSDFMKKICFLESPGAAFQDIGALLQIHMSAAKAVYIPKCVYRYRQDNANASSYNHNGYRYIAEEYEYAQRFLSEKSPVWKSAFYHKMFMHWKNRFWFMAAGSFWEDAVLDMERIADRIIDADRQGLILYGEMPEEFWAELMLFKQSPVLLYDIYRREYQRARKSLKELLCEVRNDKMVIFGCGKNGEFLHSVMVNNGITGIIAHCDNSKKLHGGFLGRTCIISPEQAVSDYPEALFIIASKAHAQKMREQLLALGICDERIIVFETGVDRRIFMESLLEESE